MASHRTCLLAAAAASLFATAALATQDPPKVVARPVPSAAEPGASPRAPTVIAPVIVEAVKPQELKRQTYDFVQTYSATTEKLDQVARWSQPLCVTVQGLPLSANAEVKARVEEVASALKVPVRGAGCRPNLQIVFTDEPQAFMDKVADEHERLLGYWHHRDRDKLKTVTRPVQAWYVTGTGGDGGDVVGPTFETMMKDSPAIRPRIGTFGNMPHGFQYDDEDNYWYSPTGCGDKARFTICLTSEFQDVLVVVDTRRMGDYGPGLISDYVVMVALVQPKSLDGCNVLPSVLDLFSQGCANFGMEGLTRADVAYLTALYKTDLQARKFAQQTDIAGRMADMLLQANATERLAAFGGAALKTSTGK
jgi:hypothetical protein